MNFQVGNYFNISFGPVPERETCDVTISQGNQTIQLKRIVFGDVYVCSGETVNSFGLTINQSIMRDTMNVSSTVLEHKRRSKE